MTARYCTGLAVRSDGSELYFTDTGTDGLSAVDLSTGTITRLLQLPCAGRIAALPGTDRLYVVCFSSVLVINRRTLVIEQHIPLRGRPDRIAAAPNGQFVAIANLEGWVDFVR